MSLYQLDKAIHRMTHTLDLEIFPRFMADPDVYARGFTLTAEEHRALVAKDIRALYLMGVQPFLLQCLGQLLSGRVLTTIKELNEFLRDHREHIADCGHPDYGT